MSALTGGAAVGVMAAYRATGFSEPVPLGVLIFAQVPFATYFQALP